jgi:putative phosphoesterase
MRLGILSDIHANLPALDAVLADLEKRQMEAVYCLGDLVGCGASPNEVVERVRALGIRTVLGDYDDEVGFNRHGSRRACDGRRETEPAERSFEWTNAQLTGENKAFLRTLRKAIRFRADRRRFLLVHGSPRRIDDSLFEHRSVATFRRFADESDADVIAFGHTHRPYARQVDRVWFVNAGSVGKPEDGDWRACYAVVSTGAKHPVEFIRVPYDVAATAPGIRDSELSDECAASLEHSGAPA